MATIIDALVVTLGLDAAKFKQGSKETDEALKKTSDEAAKTAKDFEARGKQMALALGKIRNEALGLLAVFTAGMGIKSFVQSTVSGATELKNMSENLNMSTQDLTAWQRANEMAGGSAAGMTAQLAESAKAVAGYKIGMMDEPTQKAFSYLNLNDGDMKDGETFLKARIKRIGEIYKTDPTKAMNLASMTGISPDTINLVKLGTQEVARLVAEQRNLSQLSKSDVTALDRLRRGWVNFQNTLGDIASKVLVALTPALQAVLDQFRVWGDWIAAHPDDIKVWVDKVVDAVVGMVKWVDKAAQSIGGWKNVLIALVALQVLSIVGPVISLAAALGTLAVSLTAIGGSAGIGALAVLGKLVSLGAKGGVAGALLFHSGELNAGEDAELARLRALGDADFAARSASGSPAASTRGLRNNNPGNLNFANQAGATKEGGANGRFAVFDTMEQGVAALINQLRLYASRGIDTITAIVNKYAPSSENDVGAYIAALVKSTGKGALEKLDLSDSKTMALLTGGIINHENGSGAMNTVSMVQAAQSGGPRSAGGSTSTSSSEVNIGTVNVMTQATDANGISRDIGKSLQNTAYATQMNTGLN